MAEAVLVQMAYLSFRPKGDVSICFATRAAGHA